METSSQDNDKIEILKKINKSVEEISKIINKVEGEKKAASTKGSIENLTKDSIENGIKNTRRWAIGFCISGLLFFIISSVCLYRHSQSIDFEIRDGEKKTDSQFVGNVKKAEMRSEALNTAVGVLIFGGVILEIIALMLFYFYGKSLSLLNSHFDIEERIRLANSELKYLNDNAKNNGQLILVKSLLGNESENDEGKSEKSLTTINVNLKRESSNKTSGS